MALRSDKPNRPQEDVPMWTKPSYTDVRIGFEVTMYFANR
jgi:pyrroloquinoline quinone biosynthesis protein A